MGSVHLHIATMRYTKIASRMAALFVISLVAFGCDSGAEYEYKVRSGQIYLAGASGAEDAQVRINSLRVSGEETEGNPLYQGPVVVSAGVPFIVETTTFAGGCWDSVVPSTVTAEGRTATIEVFDKWVWQADVWCPAFLAYEPRTDRITITSRGEAEVVIRGEYFDFSILAATYEEHFRPYELRFPVTVQ